MARTSKQQLKNRWQTEEGSARSLAMWDAMKRRAPAAELREIVGDLPFADEVRPLLDLRGLRFKELLILRDLDLSGARLDNAIFGGNLVGCRMVETVLDGVVAVNLMLQHDFTKASFVKANLNGAYLSRSILVEANLAGARLREADLDATSCRGANFRNADLRFACCPNIDLRGADLSGADLTEASLGGARFDAGTRLHGTIFTADGSMSRDLHAFASKSGAIIQPRRGAYEVAGFNATVAVLRERNTDKHLDAVVERMIALRDRVTGNPEYDWFEEIARQFSAEISREVEDAFSEGTSNLAHYT